MFAASKSGRVVAATATDPYFKYVPLLLETTSTNGQQNNTFLDSSTNNFTLTRNGTPTQGSITPYWPDGYWSNYFNGTTDNINATYGTAYQLGSGNFTIEFWCYFSNVNANQQVASQSNSAGNSAWAIYTTTTGVLNYYLTSNGSSYDIASGVSMGSISPNTWIHVALVRNGSVFTPYLNGVAGTTTTSASALYNSTVPITLGSSQVSSTYFGGYISNFRLVKGTAVYTAAFTPPTTPLTAITNTSLLTCQSNRFKDNSTNAFAITSTGTPKVQAFQPFSPAASYSAATYAGSGYFNGSTDYLTAPASTSWQFTADYTIEAWIYVLSLASLGTIYGTGGAGADDQFTYTTTGQLFWANQGTSAGTITTNQWLHVAAARSGTTLKIFVNGVTQLTATQTGTIGQNLTAYVGRRSDNNNPVNGYISNLRVVKGTAVYTAAFTPPTTPVTNITNTSLLLNMANAGIYDAAAQNDITTVSTAQVSTAQSKWSPSSILFNGSTDYLSNSIPSLNGAFTIEFWFYRVGTGINYCFTIGDAFTSTGLEVYIGTGGAAFNLYSNNATRITSATTPTTGAWNYIAVTRDSSNVIRLYLAGTQVGSTYTSSAAFATTLRIGAEYYNSAITGYCNGYIQDFRITNGVARTITASPTAAFPTR